MKDKLASYNILMKYQIDAIFREDLKKQQQHQCQSLNPIKEAASNS